MLLERLQDACDGDACGVELAGSSEHEARRRRRARAEAERAASKRNLATLQPPPPEIHTCSVRSRVHARDGRDHLSGGVPLEQISQMLSGTPAGAQS
jgi:hypothetical protein